MTIDALVVMLGDNLTTIIHDFWKTYNSKESFLPLYLPLIIWVSSLAYSQYKGFAFHKWYATVQY